MMTEYAKVNEGGSEKNSYNVSSGHRYLGNVSMKDFALNQRVLW